GAAARARVAARYQGRDRRRNPAPAPAHRVSRGRAPLALAGAAPPRSGRPRMNARSASILHISDTHFGTQWPAVVDALVALAHNLAPDLVVLGGDVTQRARRAQFRAAVDFLRRLPAPVLAVPGNHDIPLFDLWSRCLRPY